MARKTFLKHWIIRAKLVSPDEMSSESVGENDWLVPQKESVESVYYDTLEHSLLEQMAKSLIMAKYNIPLNWFES